MDSFIFNSNETPEQAAQRKKQQVAQAMMLGGQSPGLPAIPSAPIGFGKPAPQQAPMFSGQTRNTIGGGLSGALVGGALGGPIGAVAGALLAGGAARALHKPDRSQEAQAAMNEGWDGFSQQPQQSASTPQSPPAWTAEVGSKSIHTGSSVFPGEADDFNPAYRKIFGG